MCAESVVAHGFRVLGGVAVRRPDQIGRNQGRVLTLLMALDPRPVGESWLAHVAHPSGDQTQGMRVVRALVERGFIEQCPQSSLRGSRPPQRYSLTRAGVLAWAAWLPSFVETAVADEVG